MASLGSTPGLVIAAGVGAAASVALEPAFEVPKQEAWYRLDNKVLDPGTLARLVARGGVLLGKDDGSQLGTAYNEARRQGYSPDKLDRLVYLAQTFPGSGELDSLSNRTLITPIQVKEALTRSGLPPEWHQPVIDSFADILSPGDLAAAVHRGLVPDQGLLLGEQPKAPFNVEAYPVQKIDAVTEAAGSGYDKERLQVLVGLQGLPMGPHEAAQAYFRQIITHGDYIRAFNTSNMRNEWAQAILDQTRQIPTARDFFENALRGYHDLPWAQEQAKRHGMSDADSLVIYQNAGRPMNIHQITQALARGAKFHPEKDELTDPYKASIVEGPIKPAYYEMAESLKYTLPSAFVMRSLAQTGVWTEAKTAERLKWSGWFPADADEAAKAWAKPAGGTSTDPHLAKAQTQLWTTTHRSYIANETSRTIASHALATAGVAAASIPQVLTLWDTEKNLIRAQLTAANVKKAFNKGGKNNATGQKWTRDEALAALIELGWAALAANDYLDIP
jgi:hypothetical protein